MREVSTTLVSVLIIISVWGIASVIEDSPLVPSPVDVAMFASEANYVEVWVNFAGSLTRVSYGYMLAVIFALPFAVAAVESATWRGAIKPTHEFIRYLPVPALVPFFTILFGIEDTTKVALIFTGTYFQLFFMFQADLSSCPREYLESARSLGFGKLREITKVRIPATYPELLDSCRISYAWAWSYLLVAEVVNARVGVGYLIKQAHRTLEIDKMIFYLLLLGIFGILADRAFRLLTTFLTGWARDASGNRVA